MAVKPLIISAYTMSRGETDLTASAGTRPLPTSTACGACRQPVEETADVGAFVGATAAERIAVISGITATPDRRRAR